MSNYKKKVQKNIEKNKAKKDKKDENKNKIITLAKIIIALLVLLILATITTKAINGDFKSKDKKTEITYDEIIAGQTFNRSEEIYYVAFYEFGGAEDLTNIIDNANSPYQIYKVNLKNTMNKNVISENSNKNAKTSEELKINGPTIIKIENGKISNYIETYNKVKTYIEEL